MLIDLAESALGLVLCPLVFLLPGYVLGQVSGAWDFPRQSLRVQAAIALMLSVALGPILLYLLLHVGWWAVGLVYGASWVASIGFMVWYRPSLRPLLGPALVGGGVALVLVFLLIDIGWDDRLYFSVVARDHVRTISLTHQVSLHGVPPMNPMFHPGEAVPLFYYYGWMLMTGFVDTLGGAAVGPRGATFATTAFCGLALIGTVVTYARTLPNALDARSSGRRAKLAALLLIVGGLDLLVFLAGFLILKLAHYSFVLTDIEWWNEPFLMWVNSVLTAPHHVGALIAAMAGFLLVRWGVEAGSRRGWGAVVLAGGAFASSVLCSIWIGMGAALIGVLWVGLSVLRREWEEVRGWVTAGLVAVLLALPYLLYLRSAGTVEGAPVRVGVRPLGKAELFFPIADTWPETLIRLPFLPPIYALDLGFFALAGLLFWWFRRREGRPLSQDERLHRVVLAVGLLLPTFVMAAVRNNDLGFRVPMFAQFILLLWAADVIGALRRGAVTLPKPWLRPALVILAAVGVASSVSSVLVLRFVPPAADAGLIEMPGLYGSDRQLGARTKGAREAYAWLRAHTPTDAVVQHNPRPGLSGGEGGYVFTHALYSRRYTVTYDDDMGTMYGITRGQYDPIAVEIAQIFERSDPARVAAIADHWEIDALVVTDRDSVWHDTTSWVWTQDADFAHDHVRVFLDPAERLAP